MPVIEAVQRVTHRTEARSAGPRRDYLRRIEARGRRAFPAQTKVRLRNRLGASSSVCGESLSLAGAPSCPIQCKSK